MLLHVDQKREGPHPAALPFNYLKIRDFGMNTISRAPLDWSG